MQRRIFIFMSILFVFLLTACTGSATAQANQELPSTISKNVSSTPPAECPLTVPQDPPFTPPAPYDTLGFQGNFWFGSNSLWTAISRGGIWDGLPFEASSGYTEKIFWWREGYVWNEEPQPDLIVTGERLDAQASPLRVFPATNAYASDIGSAMLTGVEFPTPGCWKITGKFEDAELSFVVWVAP